MKICDYCKREIPYNWINWVGKFCCKECYSTIMSKYEIGDKIFTYMNSKLGKSGNLIAKLSQGTIVNIYKLHTPTKNGIYQYAIKLENDKVNYRFNHQIFTSKEECEQFVIITNKRREIMREVYKL